MVEFTEATRGRKRKRAATTNNIEPNEEIENLSPIIYVDTIYCPIHVDVNLMALDDVVEEIVEGMETAASDQDLPKINGGIKKSAAAVRHTLEKGEVQLDTGKKPNHSKNGAKKMPKYER